MREDEQQRNVEERCDDCVVVVRSDGDGVMERKDGKDVVVVAVVDDEERHRRSVGVQSAGERRGVASSPTSLDPLANSSVERRRGRRR